MIADNLDGSIKIHHLNLTQKEKALRRWLGNISLIDADEELKQEIALFLQSKGKYVKAAHIIEYLKDPEIKKKWDLKKEISLATAKRWMRKLDYRWIKKH